MVSRHSSELGSLADPKAPIGAVDLSGFDSATLVEFLESMLTIRLAEEEVGELVDRGLARAPCHLGIGQEAVAVGVSSCLSPRDRVFGGHRSHSHYLALKGSVYKLLAEILGKHEGTSKGMGGSMHLFGEEFGFYGSVPLVGATIPLAVGAGIAARMDGAGAVGVTYFGDGATEEGVFHESMNLAASMSLPVLFVCENNLFSSHLDISLRQPSDRIGRYGDAHRVATLTVDGNDVTAVARATQSLLARARAGQGPGLLEAITYRHRGHVGAKDDIDVGVRRRQEDVVLWRQRDPITRFAAALIDAGTLSAVDYEELRRKLCEAVKDASARAEKADYPPDSALLDLVYAGAAR